MIRRSLLPVVAALFAPLLSAAEVQLPAKKDFHVIILAGQSNMAGRGKVDDEARKPHPRVFSLNKENQWQPAVDPLHWDKSAAGVGFGKTFAEIVAEANPGISIGLVPTACGGSPISTWSPGQSWVQTKSNPWDDSISRARRTLQDGTLKAILWHQGESDSNAKDAGEYAKRLEDLITRFRAELNAPELPFIIGQLGRFPEKPWDEHREKVHAAQQEVARKMKNVRFVSAPDGLTSGDKVHFDTRSLRIMAKGYADAYLQLIAGAKP
jgi:hypothetical protein